MERIIEILSRRKTRNYMINEYGKDVGYIFITKKEDYVYLTIMIDKKYWGEGYGKQAMILIENEVKKFKAKKIVLGLYEANERAYNLYKNLGYVLTKREKEKVIVM